MLLFCFVIAWAIKGSLKQGTGDALEGWLGIKRKAGARTAGVMRKARTHPAKKVRYPAHAAHYGARTAAGLVYGGRASVRGGRGVWRSLWTGAKAGAAQGRERHAAYVATRTEKRAGDIDRTDRAWNLDLHWPDRTVKEPFDLAHPKGLRVWDEDDLAVRTAGFDRLVSTGELSDYDVSEVDVAAERADLAAAGDADWEDDAMHHSNAPDDSTLQPGDGARFTILQNTGEWETHLTGDRDEYERWKTDAFRQEAAGEIKNFAIDTGPIDSTPGLAPLREKAQDEDSDDPASPLASVTPIKEDTDMTAVTGEATSLDAALGLYGQWIEKLSASPAGLEQLSAGIATAGVTGDAVAAPALAAEHLNAAAAAMQQGLGALQAHLAAAEHLRALGGDEAESTEFYTAG